MEDGQVHVVAQDVEATADRLAGSADVVARAAQALGRVDFTPAAAGPRYAAEGARVAGALGGLGGALADWSQHTVTMAAALRHAGAALRGQDEDAAAVLRAVAGPRGA